MSVNKIIQEAMDKNPVGLKETLEAELLNRLTLALEAKMKEDDDEDDSDEDDSDEDDSDEDE